MLKTLLNKIKVFIELVRFEHTIFALPFAYIGMICAHKKIPSIKYWILVTLVMVFARTAAMAFNRLIDKDIDAKNPRTKNRVLVKGKISVVAVKIIICISLFGMFLTTAFLNKLCLLLSPFAALILLGYSYLKRFSWGCHLVLGLALASAPVGGWLAVEPHINYPMVLLALAVVFWVAGFDIIYSILDIEFDKKENISSIPKRFGIENSLIISRIFHLASVLFFALFGVTYVMPMSYWIGVCLAAVLLTYEQSIISPKDISRINQVFFVVNGAVSMLLFACVLIAYI